MMKDVGNGIRASNADWSFSGETVANFDQHINTSIPRYQDGHQMIVDLSDFFISNDSICYELGCATGTLSLELARHNHHKSNARFIGIDLEQEMIKEAKQRQEHQQMTSLQFVKDDVCQYNFEPSDLIIAYYTVQFIHPKQRQQLIDSIYQSLNWGGAFILFEKVRANDARFQDIMSGLYNEFKLKQGYSSEEILAKSRSLKGILEPFSTQGNLDLLKRAGFVDILSIFKHLCFEGFLAIK